MKDIELQSERKAFETWYEDYCMPVEADWFRRSVDNENEYHHVVTADAWAAWQARAAIEADRAKRVPDGWKLVPIEPTASMLHCLVYSSHPFDDDYGKALQREQRLRKDQSPEQYLEFIPYKSEFERMAGQYSRMLSASPAYAPAQKPEMLESVSVDDNSPSDLDYLPDGPEVDGFEPLEPVQQKADCGYDQGSCECMAAVQEILDSKDKGEGVSNEPWESLRRRLITLVAQQNPKPMTDEEREQKIMSKWRGRNWTVSNIIEAVEQHHGIRKD